MPTYHLVPGEEARVEQAIASEPAFSGQWHRVDDATAPIDFVWAHLDPGSAVRRRAVVLSLLDHIEVISWKNNLALLQRRLDQLPTEVIMGEDHFEAWCRAEFRASSQQQAQRVWVVKDALANGGEQVWIVSAQNWRRVTAVLRAHGAAAEAAEAAERGGVGSARLYVLQRYIERPLLWPLAADLRCRHGSSDTTAAGRKFHWRVFGLIRGDLTCHLYPQGFAHVANAPWRGAAAAGPDPEPEEEEDQDGWGEMYDRSVHITNVGVNLQDDPDGSLGVFEPYPVVDFPQELPELWSQLQQILGTTVGAAVPFMKSQRSENDHALLGLDVMQDTDGKAWLLEINAPPSLAQCGLPPAADGDQVAAGTRPDWGGKLVVRMTRDLIAQFVLPHLPCAADTPALVGEWVAVEVDPPLETSGDAAAADSSGTDENRRAWNLHKRSLAMEVCQEQAEDDRSTHKKQRTGTEGGGGLLGLGGLTGAALKDALLAKHRGQFVQAAAAE